MEYNVKMIEYKESTQIRMYNKPYYYTSTYQPKILSQKEMLENITGMDFSEKGTKDEMTERKQKKSSMNRTIQNIYKIVRSNNWEYFVTFTYDPKLTDSKDYDLVKRKLKYWLNNISKRYAPDLCYFFVPEYHADKEKLHFHGFISNIGDMPLMDSGRVAIGKHAYKKESRPYCTNTIYNLPKWRFGFSTATKIIDQKRACSYITKYITKDLDRLTSGKHRYLASKNLEIAREYYCLLYGEDKKRIIENNYQHFDYVKHQKNSLDEITVTYIEVGKHD